MKYKVLLLLLFLMLPRAVSAQQTGMPSPDSLSAKKVKVSHIQIEGNRITRSSVLLREIDIQEGDVLQKDSIEYYTEQNKLRLFNLQLFNEVVQEIQRDSPDSSITWIIRVKERFPVVPTLSVQFADRNFNTWYVKENHDLRRVMAGITLTDKDFRGNLETLAVTVQGGYTQKLGINYMMPYLDKNQVNGVGLSASFAQSRQAYYASDSDKLAYVGTYNSPVIFTQADVGLSYIYRPGYAARHVFRLSYRYYQVGDTILKLNSDYFTQQSTHASLAEIQYRFEYNGVDNWNYPLLGNKMVTVATAREGFTGIGAQSFVNVETGAFRQLWPGWYGSGIVRGRMMYPADQPYFFLGGLGSRTDYLRGYEYFVIDGDNYGLLRLDFKKALLEKTYGLRLRYFTAIPLRIYPKIFADAGYINALHPGSNYLANQLLYSCGAGVDIVSLYDVKIRLEYCVNHLGQTGLFVHFNAE